MDKFPIRQILPLLLLSFALSACTGLFGGSWQAGALQNQHIQVLTVDPKNPQAIYAGDARNGVFTSTDGGTTWKQSSTGLPLPVMVYALSFAGTSKELYAATSAGLFVSSSSAQSWTTVAHAPVDAITALTFAASSPQVIYVGTAHMGVFESKDGGGHWTNISHALPTAGTVTSLLYDSHRQQLWAAFADALYQSPDAGTSWQLMNHDLPADVGINTLALEAVTSQQVLIFAGTNHGFFLSMNDGQTWAQSQFSLANLHITSILLDANQPTVIYISTNIGVLTSQNTGETWMLLASGLAGKQEFAGLAQGDTNYSQIFVASHGIYLYPGNSGNIFDPSRIIPIALILFFFFLLYRVLTRKRRPARRAIGGPY